MAKIVGIDLGTTFSAAAYVNDNETPELIANEDGDRLTPSVIFYDEGEFIVGEYAKQNALAEPENAVEFIKREMGKSITEFSREFGGKQYAPEDISAEILKTLKRDTETELSEQVTDAVITVPACFNDLERQATIRAGEIAGLNVQRIINEPTAAALAYGKHLGGDTSKVLVFDLGGGTFDVTILEVKGQEMTILATNGDHRFGGKDWDDRIIAHVAERFELEQGENPLMNAAAYLDIQARSVDAKIQLSTLSRATIITNYAGKSDRLQLTQQEFEDMTTHLVERCRSLVDLVLDEITLTPDEIDKVLLVGGATRLPMIQNMLTEHFGQPPETSVNPDEAVVVGAAIMGELLQSEQTKPRGFLSGFLRASEQKDSDRNFGIARMSDVCSHSLGLVVFDKETSELRSSTIIAKNTNIPCDVSRNDYWTAIDNQTEFAVIVLQGPEYLEPRSCPVRAAYEVFGIPPRPAGMTRIKVTYRYNADGVIEVEAEEVGSGRVLPMRKKEGEIDWGALIRSRELENA
ncbi:Hsp70 family protein, partial [Candidatus Poribacteria bacterium]|nr:Hsp70 family protein [Candidatus Poribacteria bacterium]